MNATGTIRIVSIPDGEGLPYIREPYVGCTFPLAHPAAVEEAEAKLATLEIELPPAYWVAFADVLAGLERIQRYDWAEHLRMLTRPTLVRFPRDCAELIRA